MIRDPFERLYEAMAEELVEEARNHRAPSLRFTASSVGNCPWRQWYDLSGYRPAPLTPEAKMRMVQGEIDHNIVRNLFRKYGIEVKGVEFFADTVKEGYTSAEYPGWPVWETMSLRKAVGIEMPDGLTDTIELSARADGVVGTPMGEALFEFKGMGQWAYQAMQKALDDSPECLAARIRANRWYSYQMQVSMFLFGYKWALLGPKHRSDAQYGFVTEDGDGKPVRRGALVEYDPALANEILQSCAAIQRCVRAGTPPDTGCRELKGSGSCKNCEYAYLCHDADDRRKAGLEPVILYPGPQFEQHHEKPVSEEANQ